MQRSAIEHALSDQIDRLAANLRGRDRGVVVGLLLACVPLPPVALVGLAISLVNVRLLARGRLHSSNARLIHFSFLASAVSLVVGIAIFVLVAHFAVRLPNVLTGGAQTVADFFQSLLDRLVGIHAQPPGTNDGSQRI